MAVPNVYKVPKKCHSVLKQIIFKWNIASLRLFLNDFNLQWAIFTLKMPFLPEVKDPEGRSIHCSTTHGMAPLFYALKSCVRYLMSVLSWRYLWIKQCVDSRMQTERGNKRGGTTKKREISRTLSFIILHFSELEIQPNSGVIKVGFWRAINCLI